MNNIIKIIYIKTIEVSMFFTKFFKSYQKRSISINSKYCYININMLQYHHKK